MGKDFDGAELDVDGLEAQLNARGAAPEAATSAADDGTCRSGPGGLVAEAATSAADDVHTDMPPPVPVSCCGTGCCHS
jgi:hypothetical protein